MLGSHLGIGGTDGEDGIDGTIGIHSALLVGIDGEILIVDLLLHLDMRTLVTMEVGEITTTVITTTTRLLSTIIIRMERTMDREEMVL